MGSLLWIKYAFSLSHGSRLHFLILVSHKSMAGQLKANVLHSEIRSSYCIIKAVKLFPANSMTCILLNLFQSRHFDSSEQLQHRWGGSNWRQIWTTYMIWVMKYVGSFTSITNQNFYCENKTLLRWQQSINIFSILAVYIKLAKQLKLTSRNKCIFISCSVIVKITTANSLNQCFLKWE